MRRSNPTKAILAALAACLTLVAARPALAQDWRGVGRIHGTVVDEAGKPDTESGDRAKETIDELRSNLTAGLDAIENAIDDASGTGVLAAVSTVSATLASMQTQIRSAVDELEQLDVAGELRSAFSDAEACSSLRS